MIYLCVAYTQAAHNKTINTGRVFSHDVITDSIIIGITDVFIIVDKSIQSKPGCGGLG